MFDLIEGKCGRIPSTNYIRFIGEDLLRNWDANLKHKWIPKATLSCEPISQLMLNEKIEEYNKKLIEKDTMKNNNNDEFNGENNNEELDSNEIEPIMSQEHNNIDSLPILSELPSKELKSLLGKKNEQIFQIIKNKESSKSNRVYLLNELANKKDISLKMFNKLAQLEYTSEVRIIAFIAATYVLQKLMEESDLPRYIKNKQHLQKMIDGNFYLSKGQEGFDKLSDQNDIKYGGIIYSIKYIKPMKVFLDLIEPIYIGRTWKTKFERFSEHVHDAIDSYMKNYEMPSRMIEHVILIAIENFLRSNKTYDSTISPLNDFIRKNILGKDKWQVKKVIIEIAKKLYGTYFNMEVIEVHRNYETTKDREVWWIKNYTRLIGGKLVQGTLNPKGLNMIAFATRLGHISLPIYDIVFLLSLGYDGPQINEMLKECYHIKIHSRTIYSRIVKFWKSWDDALELFFKPVFQKLLENKENFDWQSIATTLRRHPSYKSKKNFKKWFFELSITNLRLAMSNEGFKWENLEQIAKELLEELGDNKKVKRIPIDTWIEWFVKDIGMERISKKLGYKNKISFQASWKKKDRTSIFQKEFADTYTDAVKKYRRKRTIELLTSVDFIETLLDSKLYWIYVNEFGFKSWEVYSVARPSQGLRNCKIFFEKLFRDAGLSFEDLENIKTSNLLKFRNLIPES